MNVRRREAQILHTSDNQPASTDVSARVQDQDKFALNQNHLSVSAREGRQTGSEIQIVT